MRQYSEDSLLTVRQVAELIGCTEGTLRNKMCKGADLPPHIKLGGTTIRFLYGDVMQWKNKWRESRVGA